MNFYSPYDYEQQYAQRQALEQYYAQQYYAQQQQEQLFRQQQLQQQQQARRQAQLKQQQYRQEQAQQLYDLMQRQQLEQAEQVKQVQMLQQKRAAAKQAALEKVRLAESNRQQAIQRAIQAEAEHQAALKEIARQEQEEREEELEKQRIQEKRIQEQRIQQQQAEAKARAEAKAEAQEKLKQQQLKQQQEQFQKQQKHTPCTSVNDFASIYSQLTNSGQPSFVDALKQLGVNVQYDESDEDTETLADPSESKEEPQTNQIALSGDTDVEEEPEQPQDEVHPLVAFLQALGIPATISEPQVSKAESKADPDLAMAQFVESLGDENDSAPAPPSQKALRAQNAARRAQEAAFKAAQAHAEAQEAARAQLEADNEVAQEKLEKKKAKQQQKKAKADAQAVSASPVSAPSTPLPTVVVYSSPVETEKDLSKQLAKLSAVLERSVETYERIKRASTESDSEYSNSVSSYNSRIKVIQQAQMKLESVYEQLDAITTTTAEEKQTRQTLIKKAVSAAEAIDPVVADLKAQRNKLANSTTSSDEDEIPKKVIEKAKKTKKTKRSKVNPVTGSPVRKVTLETVPDADSASD